MEANQNNQAKDYLTVMNNHGIIPNFFCSKPYLELHPEISLQTGNGWVWLQDEEWTVFPPLIVSNNPGPCPQSVKKVWCNFEIPQERFVQTAPTTPWMYEMLDWEYIFNPHLFLNMEGGNWQTFRKNSRKWVRNNPEYTYSNSIVRMLDECSDLIMDWVERKGEENLQDGDFLLKFLLLDSPEMYYGFLRNGDGDIVAINVADQNYLFWNYRICFSADEPFLDEFARLCFYTDPIILNSRKMVNDGGVLDSPGLERYKDKMNPVFKRERFSLIRK